MNLLDLLLAGSGCSPLPTPVSGAAPVLTGASGVLYVCAAPVTSLQLSSLPSEGLLELVFVSGSAAPEITLPVDALLPEGFSFEADTIYDLSLRVCAPGGTSRGLAAVQSWPLPDEEAEP